MRIIFAGTPEFAVTPLKALVEAGHEVICVYTQPDRKVGRGQKVQASAVKAYAQEQGIAVRQPLNFKNAEDIKNLAELNADLMVVVAYGLILPQAILDAPKHGCLNIHASLLPRWRGAAPIQRCLQAGDDTTGVCIMQMDAGLDTGDVLLQTELDIESHDTSKTLHDKLAKIGAKSLLSTLDNLHSLQASAIPQDTAQATYAEKITKSEAVINWQNSATAIHNQIRAFNPWPICQTSLIVEMKAEQQADEQKTIRWRIWQAELTGNETSGSSAEAGEIIQVDKTGICVACGSGTLKITKLQKDGSKPLLVSDFLNGNQITAGMQLI